ncbi:type II toxin-antitoxin system VapC family toxin [Aerosakkonema sp. BLCC-F183]|uniref:type II toxin-antitoxin system VapC family toxin n=1 Tax=Aerosakkonema sp. BLCC-F183 TaxID=3342834 RepID=UPI0035B9BE6D
MTDYLLDTNILLRMSDSNSPVHLLATRATANLIKQGHQVYITSQNIVEFWVVATRPIEVNGLGWTVEKTSTEVEELLNQFPLLEENPLIFTHWLNCVTTNNVKGKRVHDVRLIAVMLAHNITHLLTFNTDDFIGIEGIAIVHPQTVIETESVRADNKHYFWHKFRFKLTSDFIESRLIANPDRQKLVMNIRKMVTSKSHLDAGA